MSVRSASVPLESPPSWWRFRQWPGRLFDIGVVAALLALGAAIVVTSTNAIPRLSAEHIPALIVLAVPLASLLARRRHPLLTLGLIGAGILAEAFLRPAAVFQPLVMVAVYIAASRFPRQQALPISCGLAALFLTAVSIERGLSPSLVVTTLVALGAAYAVGVYVGTRAAYIDSLRARSDQLVRERELLARDAVAQERVRIARELHDVIAHHLSLISIQAGALRAEVDPESPAARTAGVIASTGHQAMEEMRRMLGVLRLGAADDGAAHTPQPAMEGIAELAAQTRAAGVAVTLSVEGEPRALPPGVELSAYRIVQEALTNVLRHAGPARCTVLVRYTPDRVELRITDDGRGPDPDAPGGGHGLVGMRERVALFGGELDTGGVPGGGFAVRATLPTASSDGVR